MKFKRSYSNARNLGSAYKFAFGGDINRAFLESYAYGEKLFWSRDRLDPEYCEESWRFKFWKHIYI